MEYRIIERDGKRIVIFPERKAYKKGRQGIELPMDKVIQLRKDGYSLRQIAEILKVEDGIRASAQTIWRRLREHE